MPAAKELTGLEKIRLKELVARSGQLGRAGLDLKLHGTSSSVRRVMTHVSMPATSRVGWNRKLRAMTKTRFGS